MRRLEDAVSPFTSRASNVRHVVTRELSERPRRGSACQEGGEVLGALERKRGLGSSPIAASRTSARDGRRRAYAE